MYSVSEGLLEMGEGAGLWMVEGDEVCFGEDGSAS